MIASAKNLLHRDERLRTCRHCGKRAVYVIKALGNFYICNNCPHRFQGKKTSSRNV